MTKRLITSLAGAAVCAAALPATAPAAPQYRSAAFRVQLHGQQVSTWERHTDTLKDDPCGSKVDAYGDQTIEFGSSDHGRLIVGGPRGRRPLIVLTNGSTPNPWAIGALADRNGTRAVDLGTNRDACAHNGGGAPPSGKQDHACGKRIGRLVPTLESAGLAKARLSAEGDGWTDDDTAPIDGTSAGSSSLDEVYEDCPFWEGGPDRLEGGSSLLPSTEKLPLEAMLSGTRRKFTIHFARVKDYRTQDFVGRTIVTGKLRLTRTTLR